MSLTTGNIAIDALVYSSWNDTAHSPVTLTYSFLARAPTGAPADDRNGFAALSMVQQAAVRDALAQWSSVANISFLEVATTSSNLQFGTNIQTDSAAYAYLPEAGINSVQMYLNNKSTYNSVFTPGTYGPSVLVHEIGHMLGLKHPGDYDSTGSSIDGPFLPAGLDNGDYTQMSYNDPSSYAINRTYATTPMLYDIQAIQYLYGTNTTYHAGTDKYTVANGTAPMCIWDAGGADTLDFSLCTGATVINLNAGSFSETARGMNNISIAYGVTIENAIAGSGGSTIYGNAAGNKLTGGAGADTFYQGAGNDTIAGGGGRDTVVFAKNFASYAVLRAGDTVTVTGDGTDILTGIENLRFADRTVGLDALIPTAQQAGTSGNDVLVAPATSVRIDGGAGHDVVTFDGARDAYQVRAVADGFSVVATATGVADMFVNVERIQFADGSGVALDVGASAGQVYRLYETAFNRTPDEGGMGYWLGALDTGVSLETAALGFTQSPEYQALYGQVDNAQFVEQLYLNALGRPYEAAGLAYHVDRLEHGASRGDIVIGFSESAELQARLIGTIAHGIDYTVLA